MSAWLLLVAVGLFFTWYDNNYGTAYQKELYRAQWDSFFDPYDEAGEAYADGLYLTSLPLIDQALAAVADSVHFDSVLVADAYDLKARVHLGLWHWVEAEQALEIGLTYAKGFAHEDLTYRLEEVQGRIEDSDSERHEQTVYLALRGLGPARALLGEVLIVYVLIDDGVQSTWSSRHRAYTQASLKRVQVWLQDQANLYGVPIPNFKERLFHYSKDPWLRTAVNAIDSENRNIGYDIAKRVAQLHGASTVNKMLDKMAKEAEADQAILIMHIAKKERSFAVRCGRGCSWNAEYAFVLKKPVRNHWDAVPYVQAHEALHLFGADDLYNIQGARNYAPRDVMHHYSRYLEASSIDSLSAFSIGWTDVLPPTPFPVKIEGSRR